MVDATYTQEPFSTHLEGNGVPTNNLCFTLLKIVLLPWKELICNWDGRTCTPQTENVWGASTLPSPPWSARWARVASSPRPRTHLAPVPWSAPGHPPSPQSSAREKSNKAIVNKEIEDRDSLVLSLASPNILRVISDPEASCLEAYPGSHWMQHASGEV